MPAELPGGGMPGTSGNKGCDAGSLPIPACLGHSSHSGRRKPPPPKVHLMQHAGPLEVTEQQAPCQISVCQGSGAKEAAANGDRAEGDIGENL